MSTLHFVAKSLNVEILNASKPNNHPQLILGPKRLYTQNPNSYASRKTHRNTKRGFVLPKVEAVILDLDGTLLDIDQRELHSINKALSAIGKPVLSVQSFIKEYYSRPYEQVGTRALLTKVIGDEAIAQHATKIYRHEFWRTMHLNKRHEGVMEVMRTLKDKKVPVAVATLRARRALVEQEIQRFHIDDFVAFLVTREDVEDPSGLPPSLSVVTEARRQQFQKTLTLLKSEPSNTLIVGDAWWDIRAAKQIQARIVWVKTGFGAHYDFSQEKPDITIMNLMELLTHIQI